jgi:hypothetical protein
VMRGESRKRKKPLPRKPSREILSRYNDSKNIYVGQYIKCSFYSERRMLLRNVICPGNEIIHHLWVPVLNVDLPALKKYDIISFSADVYKYYSGRLEKYGLCNPKNIIKM